MVSHKPVQTSKGFLHSPNFWPEVWRYQNVQKGHPLRSNYNKLEHYVANLSSKAPSHFLPEPRKLIFRSLKILLCYFCYSGLREERVFLLQGITLSAQRLL